jgi:hypothetical protein
VLFWCCKEKPHVEFTTVEGIWTINSAKRNGKLTKTLRDGFFEFDSTGNMTTNILGDTLVSAYERIDNVISQTSVVPISYTINYLDKDSMHLRAEIRNFLFDFYTSRVKNEE